LLPGLWSHLWVWQGQSGDDPSAHSAAHKDCLVRRLQATSAAAVLQSATDHRVAARIAEAYAELFTSTGKPKAGSAPELARQRLHDTAAALDQARQAADRLAQAADDHTRADREIAGIAAILPKLRADRAATEAKLQDVAALRGDLSSREADCQSTTARRTELESHDRAIRDLKHRLATQTAALLPADEKFLALTAAEEQARAAWQAADATLRQAAEEIRRCRVRHDFATAAAAAIEKTETHASVAARHAEAAKLQAELAVLRADLAKLPTLTSKDLTRLRKLESEAAQATAALEAMATGIELLESTVPVTLDGELLPPNSPRILTAPGELTVGTGTRLRIRPGGGDSLATAQARKDATADALTSALQAHALRDLDHATSALELRQSLTLQITGLETRWKAIGGETLPAELIRATTERDTATGELQRRSQLVAELTLDTDSPCPPADPAAARALIAATRDALATAEAAETAARRQTERYRANLESATAALTRQREETSLARQTVRDLETTIKTRQESHGDDTTRAQAIAAARDAEIKAATALAAIRQALANLNPELLTADLERFSRALSAQESRLRDAENTRLIARDRLTLDGSADPAAELQFATARHAAAQAAHAAEQRRAAAIELLHQLFTTSREAIDRALVAPLADRISAYLQCIFGPGTTAGVQLADSGLGGLELIRPGESAFPFAALSGGAREQTAAAVRLALAEILAADHDGCLPLVFDDAFAYSDPERIQALQRMLDLAALRGLQVIVLTCAPADYSALGATQITLPSLSEPR
jgi:hypothetical protein